MRICCLVTGRWAKSRHAGSHNFLLDRRTDEAWISNLRGLKKPPDEGFHAPIEERGARSRQKAEWGRQAGALPANRDKSQLRARTNHYSPTLNAHGRTLPRVVVTR